ncbi:MAG: dihydrolipoamide acetyltransferase family protein [Chloroflexota bacterium]
MATPIVLPKLGNTVESSIIMQWLKAVGDEVAEGDILCEVETDKATVEVESPVAGTLLAHFFNEGDDVPILVNIAAVGTMGENVDDLRPDSAEPAAPATHAAPEPEPTPAAVPTSSAPTTGNGSSGDMLRISPRARNLAQRKHIDVSTVVGTGPLGRIIERDIEAAMRSQPSVTPVAKAMLDTGEFVAPETGTGSRGRVTKADLIPAEKNQSASGAGMFEAPYKAIPLRGIRKTIARRMLESLTTTAQLTMSASADARGVLGLRRWLKQSPASLGLQAVTINDIVMYGVVQTLMDFPEMNSIFADDTIYQYRDVHPGFAVDTPQGLIVPVIRDANHMNLMELATEAHRLAQACTVGKIMPDELSGGTFTVSNLGSLGIEVFTPVLNPPQVGILGIGAITPKPVPTEDGYDFVPHMTLSLTINHQVVDGAPAARFLKQVCENIANIRDI